MNYTMIKILKAEECHIPDICKLWLEFIRYHADIDPFIAPPDNAAAGFEKEYLRPAMRSEMSLVLVALDGEKPVGYSCAEEKTIPYNSQKYGYIDHVAVTAAYRHRGIGEKMYGEIITWFRSRNISRIQVQLMAENQLADSFWRKHGFKDYQYTLFKQI